MNSADLVPSSGPAPGGEIELLICCSASAIDAERTARARRIIERGIDWNALARIAPNQGVMPLVYRYLTSALDGAIPEPALAALRREFYGNSLRNLHLARELVRLTAVLEKTGVETIAFKGPALAASAYGDIKLRQFLDLDLLVRESQAARAVEILRAEGYVPDAGYDASDTGRPGSFEISLSRPGSIMAIDLHWRLAEPYFPFGLDGEDLWRRAVRIEIEGGSVRTMALDDQMLYLCAHGARHGWQSLSGICDLAEVARSASFNWEALCERARRLGALRMLLLGALLAHDLLDADVPENVIEAAHRERSVACAARTFVNYLVNRPDGGPGLYQRWSVPVRMIDGLAPRARYVASRAFLPSAEDRASMPLPVTLYPLYYLLRPARAAFRECPAALRRLMRFGASATDGASR